MAPRAKKASKKPNPYEGLSAMKGSKLLKKLRDIDGELQKATKAEDFTGLSNLIQELRNEKLLNTDKKDVKRVLGYCGMELFRLTEGLDWSDEESRSFLHFILFALHSLEKPDSSEFNRCLKMYKDFYNSAALKVLTTVDVDCELSLELVNLILAISSQSISGINDLNTRILVSLFELYKHIPNELIDWVLTKLISKEDGSKIKDLLIIEKSKFVPSIQQFCVNLLCNAYGNESCYDSNDHIYSILVELSTLSGDFVSLLLPLVTQQFKIEDDKSRCEAVHCLCQLFCNSSIDYSKQNEGCFTEFCTRFQDRSIDIRVMMCESAKDIISCQPSSLSIFLPFLQERIKDTQWEVRRAAVDTLCNLLNTYFDEIPTEVIHNLAERVMDKRLEVRKFAITGLMNVLSIHCSDQWNHHEYLNKELEKKVGVIVLMFVRCYSFCDDETKNRCSRLLNDILISHCEDTEAISISYLWFFKELHQTYPVLEFQEEEEDMSDKSLLAFRGILRDCNKLRRLLKTVVTAAQEHIPIDNEHLSDTLLSLSYSLSINKSSHSTTIPTYGLTNNCIYCLYDLALKEEYHDTILSCLSCLCEDSVSIEEVNEVKSTLLPLLGKVEEGKRLQSQFKSLFYRFHTFFTTRDVIMTLLQLIAQGSTYSDDCIELLTVICEECPAVFMFWTIQVSLFALLQMYLNCVTNEKKLKKKEKQRWIQFMILLGKQSQEYIHHPRVLLNEEKEWNNQYDIELLPLFDVLLDNYYSFPVSTIPSVVTVISNFCRYIQSGIETVDTSIRIRYNEWLNEYLPSLSISSESSHLIIDLNGLSALLEVDSANCSHLGIRCLVDSLLSKLEETGSSFDQSDIVLSSITFLCQYTLALSHEGDTSLRILNCFYSLCQDKNSSIQVKAIQSFLRLACVKCYSSYYTCERFYQISQIIELIKEEDYLLELIHAISKDIREYQLPLKYLCYIIQCWLTNNHSIQSQIKEELKLIIAIQRQYLVYYKSHMSTTYMSPPLYQLSPEYCLVYLLPLLSRLKAYQDLNKTPSKLQIRCIDIFLSTLLSENSDNVGLLNAIMIAMHNNEDRLNPGNVILSRLIILCNQLIHKHILIVKTADVSYSETIRLPGQYYMSKKEVSNSSSRKRASSSSIESNKRMKM